MRHCPATSKLIAVVMLAGCCIAPAFAQAPLPVPQAPPPVAVPQGAPLPGPQQPAQAFAPAELERITSPIALYPDPLLAQVLAASTYSDEIPDAANWANQHHYLTGPALNSAMAADNVPWDPSIQALIPFPSVLDMMAGAMPWTQELGSAFLTDSGAVMDAVQRNRQRAYSYGYLRSNGQVVVSGGPYIEIMPLNPNYVVVPYYDPIVVYAPPRRGIVVGGAIRFGFGVTLGAAWAPWGWGTTHFAWRDRVVVVNNAPWRRAWSNRVTYVHPYTVRRVVAAPAPRVEQHRAVERSPREREAERYGRGYKEEHRKEERHKDK